MSDRDQYVVEYGDTSPDAAARCAAVFDVLNAVAATAQVDAYSDFADQMPADIVTAEAWLRGRGLAVAAGDPGARISVARDDEVGWAIVRAYAPWSIHTAIHDGDGETVAVIEDGGLLITATLDARCRDELVDSLGDSASLVLLTEWAGQERYDHEHPSRSASR